MNAIDYIIKTVHVKNAYISRLDYTQGKQIFTLDLFRIRIVQVSVPLKLKDQAVQLLFDFAGLVAQEVLSFTLSSNSKCFFFSIGRRMIFLICSET